MPERWDGPPPTLRVFQGSGFSDRLAEIKIETNALEERYLMEGRRRVNIDPGYVALERLVLATGKNYVHRIYLSKGSMQTSRSSSARGPFPAAMDLSGLCSS